MVEYFNQIYSLSYVDLILDTETPLCNFYFNIHHVHLILFQIESDASVIDGFHMNY